MAEKCVCLRGGGGAHTAEEVEEGGAGEGEGHLDQVHRREAHEHLRAECAENANRRAFLGARATRGFTSARARAHTDACAPASLAKKARSAMGMILTAK